MHIFPYLILFSIFVSGSVLSSNTNDDLLLAVVLVYRHGDRSPIFTFPTDPYPYTNKTYWPHGAGQLTNQGKRRHYEFGKWLRNRYDGFLSFNYTSDEIYIASTNVERTYMSAYSNLAGLYPPEGEEVWNPDIKWQPIPVHTAEPAIVSDFSSCENINTLVNELLTTNDNVLQFIKKYEDLLTYLTENSGTTIDWMSAYELWDTVFVQLHNNYRIPDWSLEVLNELQQIANFTFSLYGYTQQLQRLTSGPFLNNVVDHFYNVVENGTSKDVPKFLVYSAHDTNIASILSGLGAFDGQPAPYYSSSIIFELRQETNGPYVKMYHKNKEDAVPFHVNGCTFNCGLSLFEWNLRNILIDNDTWEKECTATLTKR